MRKDLREAVAGELEEEGEAEVAEAVAEAVALEVEEEVEVGASEEEEGAVVSEGEDIRCIDGQTSPVEFCINLHDLLLLWIGNLFFEQVLKIWSFVTLQLRCQLHAKMSVTE